MSDGYTDPTDWDTLSPEEKARLRDIEERQSFLEKVADGTDPILAGYELEWSPAKTKKALADPDFAALVNEMRLIPGLKVSKVIYEKALGGSEWACKMVAYNDMPERWKDVRHIEVRNTHDLPPHLQELARETVRDAVLATIGAGNVRELQPAPDDDIVDAEIVE